MKRVAALLGFTIVLMASSSVALARTDCAERIPAGFVQVKAQGPAMAYRKGKLYLLVQCLQTTATSGSLAKVLKTALNPVRVDPKTIRFDISSGGTTLRTYAVELKGRLLQVSFLDTSGKPLTDSEEEALFKRIRPAA